MLSRSHGYLVLRTEPVPTATEALQMDGYSVLRGVFGDEEVAALRTEVERVFDEHPPDHRGCLLYTSRCV